MSKILYLAAGLLVLGACATPEPADPSWTDAALRANPAAAPVTIERETISPAERAALIQAANETLEARERVREIGAALLAPTVETAEFVVEARRRARPPS